METSQANFFCSFFCTHLCVFSCQLFLLLKQLTQATNSSNFFDKEYLAAFGRAQASLALLLLARYFFFEEVFSSWHSKQASSAHDLTKTFLSFLYLLHEYLAALNIAQVNLALYSFARYFRENGR